VRLPEFLIHRHRVETAIAAAANEKFAAARAPAFRVWILCRQTELELSAFSHIARRFDVALFIQ